MKWLLIAVTALAVAWLIFVIVATAIGVEQGA